MRLPSTNASQECGQVTDTSGHLSNDSNVTDAQQTAIKTENTLDLDKSAFNRLLGRPLNEIVTLAG